MHNDLIVQIVKVQRNVDESVGFKPLWISLEWETVTVLMTIVCVTLACKKVNVVTSGVVF